MNTLDQAVSTEVRYLSEHWRTAKELPRIFDRDSRRLNTKKVDVLVRDARQSDVASQLEVNGFELFEFTPPKVDYADRERINKIYHPAIAAFVKQTTGANEVFITHHLVRTEDTSDFNKAYARFVHCDYSMTTARSASIDLLRNRQVEISNYEGADFAWYNSWQPFDHPVQQNPLAVIDATTLKDGDIVDYIYGGYGKSSKSSMPVYRREHQFYYYRDMRPNEVLLIKQLDTRTNHAKAAPHTSFVDPDAPHDALPRRSIEVRLMAVFK